MVRPREFQLGCPQGCKVKHARIGISNVWRRPLGWLASYALVLQLVLGALAGAQVSAQAAGQSWSFFEVCFGKGAEQGELPAGVPAKHTSKCAACVLAATGGAALAPEISEVVVPVFTVTESSWISRDEQLARFEASSSQRQRAPPIAA